MGIEKVSTDRGVLTWASRIAAAIERQEGRSVAGLVKPAALLAAMSGRLDLIAGWLKHLPMDLIERDPQLSYWAGSIVLFNQPAEAQVHFERAFKGFSIRPKAHWTLLAWAGIVDSIFLQYRDLRELDPWIEWMTLSHEADVDRLPQVPKELVISSMLFALAFRRPEHERMGNWVHRAERLVERNAICDLGARLSAGLVTNYIWHGDLSAAQIVCTRFRAQAARKHLSALATVLNHLNEATLYLHQGRLEPCFRAIEEGLEASRTHGIRSWDSILHCHAIVICCSKGDSSLAKHHIAKIEQLIAEGVSIDEAYYRAMLAWHAYIAGDHIGAVSRCTSALETTDAKGVPYLQAICRVLVGLVLFEAGHQTRGRELLEDGIQIGKTLGNPVVRWIGELFIAHMEFASGNHLAGDATLEAAMSVGRDYSLAHVFCWPREIIRRLVDRVLVRGFSPDYARFLIAMHRFTPGEQPTRSDQWLFDIRFYSLGQPRIEFSDGRVDGLSVQFKRQIELLTTLIAADGRPTPLHNIASNLYQFDDVEEIGSLKHVLHSLRKRMGPVVIQRNSALQFDFGKVWIDAASFLFLRRNGTNESEIEAWLDLYYQGHFMENIENSEIVLGLRRLLCDQVEVILRKAYAQKMEQGVSETVKRFEGRWGRLFPSVFTP